MSKTVLRPTPATVFTLLDAWIESEGNTSAGRLMREARSLLEQFAAVTDPSLEKLPCQRCKTTGKVDGFAVCLPCQGSGMVWNPHPARRPHVHTTAEF